MLLREKFLNSINSCPDITEKEKDATIRYWWIDGPPVSFSEILKEYQRRWGAPKTKQKLKETIENGTRKFLSHLKIQHGLSANDIKVWNGLKKIKTPILQIEQNNEQSLVNLRRVSWVHVDANGLSLRSNLKNHTANFNIGAKLFFDAIEVQPVHVLDRWERISRKIDF